MHVDAEPLADHAARVGDAALAVERVADGQRMDDGAAGDDGVVAAGGEHAADILLGDRLAGEIDGSRAGLAGEAAGGNVDDERLDGDAGHALGGVDGDADGLLGRVEIGDDARLDAARSLMADAEHFDGVGAPTERLARFGRSEPRDEAADLGRADVEDRNDRRTARETAPFGSAEHTHQVFVLPRLAIFSRSLSAASWATTPASVNRTIRCPGWRRSIAAISRESTA